MENASKGKELQGQDPQAGSARIDDPILKFAGADATPETHQPLRSDEKEVAFLNIASMDVAALVPQADRSDDKLAASSNILERSSTEDISHPEISWSKA